MSGYFLNFWVLFVLLTTHAVPARAEVSECGRIAPHCSASVIEAMDRAWRRSGMGHLRTEAGFCLIWERFSSEDGQSGCRYKIAELPFTNESAKITFVPPRGCNSIFHTHPNFAVPEPSPGDRQTADKIHARVYTITSKGLFVYSPFERTTTRLRANLDWNQPCQGGDEQWRLEGLDGSDREL